MKRGKGRSWHVGRWALIAVLLLALSGCEEPTGTWFQVRNDSSSQAFVILDAKLGRYVYTLEPGANVAIGDFLFSFDGDVDVLGPTCTVVAVFKSPISQTNVLTQPTNRWEGVYQITIPSVGQPSFADTRKGSIDPDLPTITGAVLDPAKSDPSVCPPPTVPGASPDCDVRRDEAGALAS